MKSIRRLAVAALGVGILIASPLDAQLAVFPTAEPGRWARVEAGRPDVDAPAERGGLSAAWFLTFTTPIPGGVVMVMELPVAHTEHGPTTSMGNPYIAARLQFDARILSEFEVGIRLPLANEASDALGYGLWTDLADRPEAFHPRAMPLTLRAVRTFEGRHGAVDLASGTIWWLMSGPEHTEQNLFVTYSGQARTELGPLRIAAGASGRYSALGRAIEPLEGVTHQFSGSVDLGGGSRIRPGAFVTVPLSQPATERMAATFGFRVLLALDD